MSNLNINYKPPDINCPKEWYKDNDYKKILEPYLWKKVHNTYHLNPDNLPPEIILNKKRENLKGQEYNNIKILYPCGYNIDHRVMYVCKCFCGNYFISSGKNIKKGNTQSCDCLRSQRVVDSNVSRSEDIIGKTFGKLKVLEFVDFRKKRSGKRSGVYKCECQCGRICYKEGVYLRHGDTQTCGLCTRKSHGELAIANFLDKRNIRYITEYSFDDCLSQRGYHLYFDFAIIDEKNKIICLIEFDGEQHYNSDLKGWFTNSYKDLHQRDLIKNKYCEDNNIILYRIRFDENLLERMEEIIYEL